MGLQPSSPFWGAFFSRHLSLPPALDSPLLFPAWGTGNPAQLHNSLGPGRDAGWKAAVVSVLCLLMATGCLEQLLHWGLGSSLLAVRIGLTEHGDFLRKPWRRGSAPKTRDKGKEGLPVLPDLRRGRVPENQDSCIFIWQVSLNGRGTLTQCLNFLTHTMGLRDLGG